MKKTGAFNYTMRRGASPTFNCECCGHRTNNSADDSFCPPCYELLGVQNALWDNGVEAWQIQERTRLTRGMKPERVAKMAERSLRDLFAAEMPAGAAA